MLGARAARVYNIAASRPVAAEALARIAGLCAIEQEIRSRSADQRRAARQELSAPIVADLRQFLDANLARSSRKSKLADAIRYALTRWTGLSRFLDDGRLKIDSNTVERSIRPQALNRKNALFTGSDEGGDRWAVIASMIETCKLSGMDPQAWLAETGVAAMVRGEWARRRAKLQRTARIWRRASPTSTA